MKPVNVPEPVQTLYCPVVFINFYVRYEATQNITNIIASTADSQLNLPWALLIVYTDTAPRNLILQLDQEFNDGTLTIKGNYNLDVEISTFKDVTMSTYAYYSENGEMEKVVQGVKLETPLLDFTVDIEDVNNNEIVIVLANIFISARSSYTVPLRSLWNIFDINENG